MFTRRTKIVCTIGPSSNSPEAIESLIEAGMDVARLNFSHGTHDDHQRAVNAIRDASARYRKAITILGDLSGPKIRAGRIGGAREVVAGDTLCLMAGEDAPPGVIPIRYETLATDLRSGDAIHADDGRIRLRVTEIKGDRVHVVVEEGGRLRDAVGIHLPSGNLQLDALTAKDKLDLEFGLAAGIDYVALSFVRSVDDVRRVREFCEARGRIVPVCSKIETPQAIDHLEAIVEASDAVMVARGDLGVEFPPEQVPVLQHRVLVCAAARRRPAIVATEMLHSMVTSTRPTRAEASDVANAIFDGADATMLSGETASGAHPALAVGMMARIISAAESSPYWKPEQPPAHARPMPFPEATARMAVMASTDLDARLIAVFTQGGDTARLISKERPTVPVVAFSPSEVVRRRLGLLWGVTARVMEPLGDTDEMVEGVQAHLLASGMVTAGDRIVVVFGAPIAVKGKTNSVRVHQVGG
ncbi:MAG: pyruvate kinase [Myxococcaceae bacterium]|nr:pyruvate kinase [Deltaproteobacteria bacterium]TAK30768.1 MAG: pyruvate kinase [Myxococcaceae bacterium]